MAERTVTLEIKRQANPDAPAVWETFNLPWRPGMKPKMLKLTFDAPAEKIIRQELQRLGAPTRFLIVPGDSGTPQSAAPMAAPMAGSVQEAALSHPSVQRAKEIFQAEVRSVIDLRKT